LKSKLFGQVSGRLKEIISAEYGNKWTRFANSLGIPQGTMKPWLDGDSMPGGEHLAKMAAAGIDVSYLLSGVRSGDKPPASHPDPEIARYLEKTRRILESGTSTAEVLKSNIQEFDKLICHPKEEPPVKPKEVNPVARKRAAGSGGY